MMYAICSNRWPRHDPWPAVVSSAIRVLTFGICRNTRLIDAQTGVERQGQSNDAGFYKFPLVPTGNYRLSVEANGFKSVTAAT